MNYTKNHRGFAVLLSILVLAVIGVGVSTSLLYLSINASQSSIAIQESAEANDLANTCAEIALQKLVTSSAFTGTATTTLGQGTCNYALTALSGSADSIKSTGTVGATVRKVQMTIAIPQLTISLWQEVGDFN